MASLILVCQPLLVGPPLGYDGSYYGSLESQSFRSDSILSRLIDSREFVLLVVSQYVTIYVNILQTKPKYSVIMFLDSEGKVQPAIAAD